MLIRYRHGRSIVIVITIWQWFIKTLLEITTLAKKLFKHHGPVNMVRPSQRHGFLNSGYKWTQPWSIFSWLTSPIWHLCLYQVRIWSTGFFYYTATKSESKALFTVLWSRKLTPYSAATNNWAWAQIITCISCIVSQIWWLRSKLNSFFYNFVSWHSLS